MKTKKELNALKKEVETMNNKPHELTDDEFSQVSGGVIKKKSKDDESFFGQSGNDPFGDEFPVNGGQSE